MKKDGKIDGQMDRLTVSQMGLRKDRQIVGETDGWTDRWMDRQMDGQTGGWTDR